MPFFRGAEQRGIRRSAPSPTKISVLDLNEDRVFAHIGLAHVRQRAPLPHAEPGHRRFLGIRTTRCSVYSLPSLGFQDVYTTRGFAEHRLRRGRSASDRAATVADSEWTTASRAPTCKATWSRRRSSSQARRSRISYRSTHISRPRQTAPGRPASSTAVAIPRSTETIDNDMYRNSFYGNDSWTMKRPRAGAVRPALRGTESSDRLRHLRGQRDRPARQLRVDGRQGARHRRARRLRPRRHLRAALPARLRVQSARFVQRAIRHRSRSAAARRGTFRRPVRTTTTSWHGVWNGFGINPVSFHAAAAVRQLRHLARARVRTLTASSSPSTRAAHYDVIVNSQQVTFTTQAPRFPAPSR